MPESVLQRCKAWREKNQDLLEQEGVSLSSLSLGILILFHLAACSIDFNTLFMFCCDCNRNVV